MGGEMQVLQDSDCAQLNVVQACRTQLRSRVRPVLLWRTTCSPFDCVHGRFQGHRLSSSNVLQVSQSQTSHTG
jgi:hypothetical protein